MRSEEEIIPETVGGCRVLYFTTIDERHKPTHAYRHTVDGKIIEQVWGLAICQRLDHPSFYLFRCEYDYVPITNTWHATLEEAFEQAEFEYVGVNATWQQFPNSSAVS